MGATIGGKIYDHWRDSMADELNDETRLQKHMVGEGARQIGAALYIEKPKLKRTGAELDALAELIRKS